MEIIIREFEEEDFENIRTIFNQYAEEGYSVLAPNSLDVYGFNLLIENARTIFVMEKDDMIIGFGYIGKYKRYKNFDATGVLTYFIVREYTAKGLGTKLFNALIELGKKLGITNYLANVTSKNIQSLNFHRKMGFKEVGYFKNVFKKFNEQIDIVWFQKQIN